MYAANIMTHLFKLITRIQFSACAANRYGQGCTENCHCENSSHCDQDTGPLVICVCQQGFYKNDTAGDHLCLPGNYGSHFHNVNHMQALTFCFFD